MIPLPKHERPASSTGMSSILVGVRVRVFVRTNSVVFTDFGATIMFRKDLVNLLQHHPQSLNDLAQLLEMSQRDVEDDIRHLMKSLKHSAYRLQITPTRCRKCGFVFQKDKLHKPGKCPQCHETWIQEPLIEIKTQR